MSSAGQTTTNLVLSAASQLTAAQFETYQRLCKRLLHGPQFQLIVLDCRDERLQQQLQQLLTELCQQADLPATKLILDESIPDVFVLQQQLQALASQFGVIQLIGAALWFSQPNHWASFNLLRENIASQSPCRLLLWLNAESIAVMIEQAPDWWAWRSGVYEFVTEHHMEQAPIVSADFLKHSSQHQGQATRRIAELNQWLNTSEATDPEIASPLWFELAMLYKNFGEWDRALSIFQSHCLPNFEHLGDDRSIAVTKGKIAQIFILRGELEKALELLNNEVLPLFHKLGDIKNTAACLDSIADIHYNRGEFEKAMQIREQQVLPAYLKLADVRGIAYMYGKIADIFIKTGFFDRALSLLQHETLPVLQKLGDVRGITTTQTKFAEIFIRRGELEQAYRLLMHDIIPTYQKLGDSPNLAVSQSKLADILSSRGELTKALHIYQSQVLPTVLKLHNQDQEHQVQQRILELQHALGATGTN